MAFINGEANETGFKMKLEIQRSADVLCIKHATRDYRDLDEDDLIAPVLARQWHGCEHKAFNLFLSGKVMTFYNLKKSSRFTPWDGTSKFICLLFFTWFCFSVYLIFFPLNFLFDLLVLICLWLMIWKTPLESLALWLSWPLGILVQLFNTDEPEDWQLKQGLEVIKLIKTECEIRKFVFPFSTE